MKIDGNWHSIQSLVNEFSPEIKERYGDNELLAKILNHENITLSEYSVLDWIQLSHLIRFIKLIKKEPELSQLADIIDTIISFEIDGIPIVLMDDVSIDDFDKAIPMKMPITSYSKLFGNFDNLKQVCQNIETKIDNTINKSKLYYLISALSTLTSILDEIEMHMICTPEDEIDDKINHVLNRRCFLKQFVIDMIME